MKVIIKNHDKIIQIQDWFCEQAGIDRHSADLVGETEKAFLLDFPEMSVWIPKSLCTLHPIPKGLEEWQ